MQIVGHTRNGEHDEIKWVTLALGRELVNCQF